MSQSTRYCTNCGHSLREKIRCKHCFTFDTKRLHARLDSYYKDSKLSKKSGSLYVGKEKYRRNVKRMFPILERIAINEEKTTYTAVSDDLYRRGRYLAAIGEVEYHDGRPLLPSIVVRVEGGQKTFPNKGYFIMAQNLESGPDDLVDRSEHNRKNGGNPDERKSIRTGANSIMSHQKPIERM